MRRWVCGACVLDCTPVSSSLMAHILGDELEESE